MADGVDVPMQSMQPSARRGPLDRAVGIAELGAQLPTRDDTVLPARQVGKCSVSITNRSVSIGNRAR